MKLGWLGSGMKKEIPQRLRDFFRSLSGQSSRSPDRPMSGLPTSTVLDAFCCIGIPFRSFIERSVKACKSLQSPMPRGVRAIGIRDPEEQAAAGKVVLVRFPFSDLSESKLRPAIVLAGAGRGD